MEAPRHVTARLLRLVRLRRPRRARERHVDIARRGAGAERRGERHVLAALLERGLDVLLPAALGDVDRVALLDGVDGEGRGAGDAWGGVSMSEKGEGIMGYAPVVDVGLPWHFWMLPAMPPQI